MKLVVVIPTYNEVENITALIREIMSQPLPVEVLVVDDNSPDGTAAEVKKNFSDNPRVHLLVRYTDRGRGAAGREGFYRALEFGADYVVEMDADFSHSPDHLVDFWKQRGLASVIIGSRYVVGGRDIERNFCRRLISAFARNYLNLLLGVSLADPTSGFRMFSRPVLEKILPYLRARDQFMVAEIIYYLKKFNFTIKEIPITFRDRQKGSSKLKFFTLLKYLIRVIFLPWRKD